MLGSFYIFCIAPLPHCQVKEPIILGGMAEEGG